MAKSTTTRLGLQRWTADTDSQDRTEFDGAHAQLEALAAGFIRDVIGSRPAAAAAYEGFWFEATDESGALYWCTGSAWLGPFALVSDLDAAEVTFDPTGLTELTATDVQGALVEVDTALASGSSDDADQPGNSGLVTLDWSQYRTWDIDPTGPVEIAFSNLPAVGKSVSGLLVVRNADQAITWPVGVQAPGGSLSLAGKSHVPLTVERDQTVVIGTPWVSVKELVNLPEIGEAFMGGFFAGIIDTTRGNIIANDAYQSGLRYALIVSGKSLEGGPDTGTGDLRWHASGSQTVAGAQTRWDGLAATAALAGASFEAAHYCRGLPHPSDDGSAWCLPALDELEKVYRELKPDGTANQTGSRDGGTFPGGGSSAFTYGVNPSSDPAGAAYTAADPAQTPVAAFQAGGAEALSTSHYYWTSTWYSTTGAWVQHGSNGYQLSNTQTNPTRRVRPVRRLVL